ncbi:MAG: 30S ribosomal protein S3 [Oscillospiraceae bacterium]
MGQKINPHGFRVGVIMDWDSRWFTSKREFGDTLVEDHKIRTVLKKQLYDAGIPKIEIERTVDSETRAPKVKVNIYCAKAGMVIGRAGAGIEKLRLQIEKICGGKSVNVNIIEVKNADVNAQLVAENIAGQLERRISFRRAMKLCMGRAMRLGAKGIKAQVGGRLGGADIARSEHYHEGTIPLQTLRANIDYGFAEANTTYGKIGVKVWIYKGEVLKGAKPQPRQEGGNK